MTDTRGYFGLVPEGTFLYGCLRTADGVIFEPTRRIPASPTDRGMSGLIVQSTLNDDNVLHIDGSASAAAATSRGCSVTVEGDDELAIWASAAGAEGKPWRVTMSQDAVTWSEADAMELTGRLLPPGLQWHVPAPDKGILYVSQLYEVSGTADGRAVRGFIGLDRTWMAEGGMLYVKKDVLVGEQLHNTWYTWATKYTDGTYDAGHFMLANDRGGFALLTNERQEILRTTAVTGEVFPGEDRNFPKDITLEINGEKWEFLPDPHGIMPDFLSAAKKLPTPQNEGRWRRVGDTREPDIWFAWGEIAPGHGTTPTQRWRS
ncbi:hypothetical protein IRT45_09085 [Nocardia sp. BSTN01]|uniref:hypothetical protein n=1 Tax=Nocardia sp. BSTN01 TaxID=2783665 RepID=UPI0018902A83|nr:hypothetical protein [Nocardia sp. BSTN01]MBF4997310.1 hypothetical protein [Nocardia sp. BSTN01]